MKVFIQGEERYPDYQVRDAEASWTSNFIYEVDEGTAQRWRETEMAYNRTQAEISAFVRSKWKDNERVDL